MAFVHKIFNVLWIYSYLIIGLVCGAAFTPSFLLLHWAWTQPSLFGVGLIGPAASIGGQVLRAFLVSTCIAYAWFLFGLALAFLMMLLRPFLGKSKEGDLPIPSWGLWQFYNYDGLLLFYSLVYASFLRSTAFYPVYLRMMGAKVGKNVIVNTNKVYDLDMLEIGDNTIIGGDVIIIGHVAEGRKIHRKRVKIGRNVTIGQMTSIFPGVVIEDNVVVGAHSLLLKDMHLPANTVWGGVPARELAHRDLSHLIDPPATTAATASAVPSRR